MIPEIRHDLRPGDLGAIVQLHGIIYAREHGFDHTFEAYVAAGVAEFALSFHPGRERVWTAEAEGRMIGSVAIVRRSEEEAQLRWFLLESRYRGLSIGKKLLNEAIQFSRDCKYRSVFLWTLQHLEAATHLYTSFGFEKKEEKIHPLWGKTVHEEKYELNLK